MKKRLLSLLLVLVLAVGLLPVSALATEGTETPPALENTATHGYLKNLVFDYHYAVGALPGFTFEPGKSSYDILQPDVATAPQLRLSFADTLPENLYYKVVDSAGKTLAVIPEKPAVAGADRQLRLLSVLGTAKIGTLAEYRLLIGVKNSNGEYEEADTYTFRVKRRAALHVFEVQTDDGTILPLSPAFSNSYKMAYEYDYATVAPKGTKKLQLKLSPWSASRKTNLLAIKLDGETRELSDDDLYEVDLTRYTPDENDVVTIPFQLAYTGPDGMGEGTSYTLRVSIKDVLPLISGQPQSVTCDKGEVVTLAVDAALPEAGGALSYQWYRNTQPIDGATERSYTVPTDRACDTPYLCRVSNTVDGVTYTIPTEAALVTVRLSYITPPEIVKFEGGGECMAGEQVLSFAIDEAHVDLGVLASWKLYRNTVNSTEGGTCVSTAGYGYLVPPAESAGTYYYYCEVTLTDKNGVAEPVSVKSDKTLSIQYKSYQDIITLDGQGTEETPYKIQSYEDLCKVRAWVKEGYTLEDQHFLLTTDIELPADWMPIGALKGQDAFLDFCDWRTVSSLGDSQYTYTNKGTELLPFSGILDGDGHKITVAEGGLPLLNIVRSATVKNLHIFGRKIISNGLVANYVVDYGADGDYNTGCPDTITIENVTLDSGSSTLYSGLIGGYASGRNNVYIRNCLVENGVTIGYDRQQYEVGSFGGYFNGVVTNCVSYADVYGTDMVGGIVGSKGQSMGKCVVQNCAFHGTVNATGDYSGGILGSGYKSSTAPNTPVATVRNCLVTGNINGGEYVGGVFGGEPSCLSCWSNGKGSVTDNVFTGNLTATGEYKGGIIGFMKSYNENQSMDNNFYIDICGTDKGIGAIEINNVENLDLTNCGAAVSDSQLKDGSVVTKLNASETSFKNWVQGEKHPELSKEPVVTALTVSGTYKTEYYVGDALDLSGAVLSAEWTDGTNTTVDVKDVKITGYAPNTRGVQTVTLAYGAAKTEIEVTVLKRPTTGNDKISVSFIAYGDVIHSEKDEATGNGLPTSDGGPHTLKNGKLVVWSPQRSYEVDQNATVWDVIQLAMGADYDFDTNEGLGTTYIAGVKPKSGGEATWLKEFTNGPGSGWMYTLNGEHPNLGVAQQYLDSGDVIVFHYTDDYTVERGSEHWSAPETATEKPKVTVQTGADGKPVAKVELPKGASSAVVTIPTAELGSGNVLVLVKPDGSEEIIRKSLVDGGNAYALVTADCTVKMVDNSKPFTDTANHWAKDAIAFASSHELFAGTAANTFSPDMAMSRAMLAAVLYRLEDATANGGNPFADVKADTWYTDAVTWASANKIVSGTGKGFEPDRDITRQELVVMLYRYAKFAGMDMTRTTNLASFTDSGEVADWAKESMSWAVANGLVSGRSATTLVPTGTATRAEVAAILQRLVGLMVK